MGFSRNSIASDLDNAADYIYDTVVDMLKNQPYSVECRECGKSLDFSAKVDSDNDVCVEVERCGCEL